MNPKKKALARATVEQVKEYEELNERLDRMDFQLVPNAEARAIMKRLDALKTGYDWANYVFTDPETGKKGIKDVAGNILVPAQYDGFTSPGSYLWCHTQPQVALKDGMYGIVAADGTGKELSDFRFDFLLLDYYTSLYIAYWDGNKEKFGFVTHEGVLFIPNVLTKAHEPWNDFMLLEGDGKFGALDVRTFEFVLPTYDKVDYTPDEDVVFYKDGVEGYIVEETGEFITKEQYQNDDQYIDAYLYNTRIND